MTYLISGLIGIIGVVIGSVLTYYLTRLHFQKQIEIHQAYEFISRNYLPLLSALSEYKYSIWMMQTVKRNEFPQNLNMYQFSEDETKKICREYLISLQEAMNRLIMSGMSLLIAHRNKELVSILAGLNYRLNCAKVKSSEKEIFEDANNTIDTNLIDVLRDELTKISISELVKEYQVIMTKGYKGEDWPSYSLDDYIKKHLSNNSLDSKKKI